MTTFTTETLSSVATAALFDVVAERRRQIEAEGWTAQHDDGQLRGQMAAAAAAYAWHASLEKSDRERVADPFSLVAFLWRSIWPTYRPGEWNKRWWKPTDRRRDLVKAGALILAEIDRLDRVEAKKAAS